MKIGTVVSKGINVRELSDRCTSLCAGQKPDNNGLNIMSMIISHQSGQKVSPQLINNIVYRNILKGDIV
jgi:hypothetical protein